MYGLVEATLDEMSKGQAFSPQIKTSGNFKNWISIEDEKRCIDCEENHGKIYPIEEKPKPKPPLHLFCRCAIINMLAITAGTATINGINGADWKLIFEGTLPEYYVSLQEAANAGWRYGRWPSNFVPGKMISRGAYDNSDGHLPSAPNRQWYEADINYMSGKRNNQRVIWSNDGLVFVTYDHYETFYEIIGG